MQSVRDLPSVDEVLRRVRLEGIPQALVTQEIRAVISERRNQLLDGRVVESVPIEIAVERRLQELLISSLRPVINATGVILHTNLGRSPLPDFQPIQGYSNLEYDLKTGRRGKRDVHTSRLLEALLAKPAIIVNNNAAAVYLVLNELANGGEVIVSRGELIEIGDGFRIPEIMARSGAVLREVGTTNRTRISDYEQAISNNTRMILRVHPSNFHVSGFTARPDLQDLVDLGRIRKVPLYEDLGSGCLVDLSRHGVHEPLARTSLDAGVNIVSFSCDKLLGGPQSGIIAGDSTFVQQVRRNPMYRAFRVDKLVIEALETTLRYLVIQNWNAIPTLQMIFARPEELRSRAERIAAQLREFHPAVRQGESPIGGGSTPEQMLPTWVVELEVTKPSSFEASLRQSEIPVIARIERDKIVLDMRTVAEREEKQLVDAVRGTAQA
jgi:L-seryl-tRNA(Ser) seleniumtransferase